MSEARVFPFHIMEPVGAKSSIAYRLATFRPERPAKVIGATLGLLTNSIFDHTEGCVELYVSVTYNPNEPTIDRNWESMKKDFVFYLQRDVYGEPTGADDLTRSIWLPDAAYFLASADRPLHVDVGVGNFLPYKTDYDALGCLYYLDG